jgi:sporulation integral membrane protein YlbJ
VDKVQSAGRGRGKIGTTLAAAIAVILTVFIVLNPEPAFGAAVHGLKVWWDIVFPALLPFFIGSEILMGLGVVHLMGVLLEPLMRPLFNVPGAGSFVLAMGLASGYPIGAMLTARLREQGLCTKVEGERLMSFANTADPLFMTGAVAVGMFGRVDIAVALLGAHYLSALSVGVLMRFYRMRDPGSAAVDRGQSGSLAARAWNALHDARARDGRPFGKLLGDSIGKSVNTLLLIGGFIILFSVFVRTLDLIGAVGWLTAGGQALLSAFGVDPAVVRAMVSGLFEITIGAEAASQAQASLMARVAAASAIIAWSGLSVHAQVAAMVQGSGMRVGPYMVARAMHAGLAALYTVWLWQPVAAWITAAGWSIPVFWQLSPGVGDTAAWAHRMAICGVSIGGVLLGLFVLFGFVVVIRGVTFVFIETPRASRRR